MCRVTAALAAGVGGFPALLVARVLTLGNSFLVSVALLWHLGLPAAGTYALAAFPAAAANIVSAMGLSNALPRLGTANGERATVSLIAWVAILPPTVVVCAAYGLAVGTDPAEAAAIAMFAAGGSAFGPLGTQQMLYLLQGRTRWAPLAPAVQLAGIGLATFSTDLVWFAAVLTASRLLGCAIGFALLEFRRTSASGVAAAIHEGLRFLPLDLLAAASDLGAIPLLAGFLSRSELGLFGLARQFVSVADTPGWSYVQSRYPGMVADFGAVASDVAKRNEEISFASAAAVLLLASATALAIYRQPALLPVLPLALLPLPARYMNNFCDQALRACGRIRECALLGGAKLAISLTVFLVLPPISGFWGAVAASAAVSWVSGYAYRRGLLAIYPESLPHFRIWRFA